MWERGFVSLPKVPIEDRKIDWETGHRKQKRWLSEDAISWSRNPRTFEGTAIDGSSSAISGKFAARGWAVVQMDLDDVVFWHGVARNSMERTEICNNNLFYEVICICGNLFVQVRVGAGFQQSEQNKQL